MEAGGLGPEGPGACLERRSGAPRCPREPVRLQDPVIPDLVSASLYKLNSNKPRYHKNSRAYKVPQFLERGFPRANTTL